MRLTTKGRFAVTALLDLAQQGQDKPVSLADISARQHISLAYLEQLFVPLRQRGLVSSVRGPGGGYQLALSASHIQVLQVIQAVNEAIDSTQCGGSKNCHDDKLCMTHDLWNALNDTIAGYLSQITLADVLAQRLPNKPSTIVFCV